MNDINTTPRKRRVIVRMVLWSLSLLLLGAVAAGAYGAYGLYGWRWGDAGVSTCRDPELQQVLRSLDERLCSHELREETRQMVAAVDGFRSMTMKDGEITIEEMQGTALTRARQQLEADIFIREMHAPLRDIIRRAAEEGRANVSDENGCTLLLMALHYHQPALVPYLLEHGGDPNKVCDTFTAGILQETALSAALRLSPYGALKCAPVEERTAMLRLLCSHGAEWANMPRCQTIVAATLYAENSKADAETLLRTMLELGFRPDLYTEKGEHAIFFCALSAMPHAVEMAQELQRLGCLNSDPNVPMRDSFPLHEAIHGENVALVAWLLEQGADPNAEDKRNHGTPLRIVLDTMSVMADDGDEDEDSAPDPAEEEEMKNLTDILELLLRHGATTPPADTIPFDKLPPRAAELLRRACGAE